MTAVLDGCRTGTIVGIEDHGTIVMLMVLSGDERTFFVPFDHTPFRWLIEGESADLIGREIGYDGESVWFLDGEIE